MERIEFEYVSAAHEEEEYNLADNRVAGDECRDDQEEEEEDEEDFIDEDVYGDDDEPVNYSVRAGPKKKKSKAPSPGRTKPSPPTAGGAASVVSPPSASTSAAAKASKGLQKNGRDYLKPAHLVYQVHVSRGEHDDCHTALTPLLPHYATAAVQVGPQAEPPSRLLHHRTPRPL
jgi:hypothetical protein